MRSKTLLLLLAASLAMMISGCGGKAWDYRVYPGEFFPRETGATWDYDIYARTYYLNDVWEQTGTVTRVADDNTAASPGGELINTTQFTEIYSPMTPPTLPVASSDIMQQYCNYLFSNSGGLQPWREYYGTYDMDLDTNQDLVRLDAHGATGGAGIAVPYRQPFLRIPIINGDGWENSYPFSVIPMYSNNATVSDTVSNLTVQFREPENILGEQRNVMDYVESLQATVNFDGETGLVVGKAETLIAEGIGVWQKDVDLEFRFGSRWLRLYIRTDATNYSSASD